MNKNQLTSKQTTLLAALHSIGERLHEITDKSFIPAHKTLFIDYKEFKNALEFYFANRVDEK